MTRAPLIFSWSGGKDSAMALFDLQQGGPWRPAGLLTTVTEGHDRISMHGVRRDLLEAQARALGLPLHLAWIPKEASNDIYEACMTAALRAAQARGEAAVGFADLFLEDVRAYRLRMLEPLGMEAVFPVWGRDTAAFAREFVARGFRAVVVCVDTEQIDAGFAGRELDAQFFADLPPGADPCGENGEYHTFVYDGPNFSAPVPVRPGHIEARGRFHFCELEDA